MQLRAPYITHIFKSPFVFARISGSEEGGLRYQYAS